MPDPGSISSIPTGDFMKISSSISPYRKAVSTSITRLSSFFYHHPCKCYPERNIMSNWFKIFYVVNSWNLTVSQCYQSCPVSAISLDLEYPLISNKSSIAWYLLSICLSQTPLSIMLPFLMAALQLSLSFSIG